MAKKAKTEAEIARFRESVCDVATRLFIERGPQNVTMRQIASEVGVSPMTPSDRRQVEWAQRIETHHARQVSF